MNFCDTGDPPYRLKLCGVGHCRLIENDSFLTVKSAIDEKGSTQCSLTGWFQNCCLFVFVSLKVILPPIDGGGGEAGESKRWISCNSGPWSDPKCRQQRDLMLWCLLMILLGLHKQMAFVQLPWSVDIQTSHYSHQVDLELRLFCHLLVSRVKCQA